MSTEGTEMTNTHIETFKKAEDFLNYLQIRHNRWLPDEALSSPWVFRGHADAKWKLIPSALRRAESEEKKSDAECIIEYAKERCKLHPQLSNKIDFFRKQMEAFWQRGWNGKEQNERLIELCLQDTAEFLVVNEFCLLADELGHPVPSGYILSFDEFVSRVDFILQPKQLENIEKNSFDFQVGVRCQSALAQHHGVPTRYLDWTHNPFMAAFFAADIIFRDDTPSDLAVWAIRTDFIQNGSTSLKILTCPQSELSYLHAQRGLFTYDEGANQYFVQNGQWRSIEEIIDKVDLAGSESPLRKLVLPITEVKNLLRLLWAEGITRAHLMPTYDNVTATLKTRWL